MNDEARAGIRPARRDEIEAVLALWREAAAEPGVPDTAEAVEALLDRDPESLLVAEDAGMVVGAIVAGWDGWRGSLYRLAVLPGHRRLGLGLRLTFDAERRLRAKGARRIQAMVYASEERAQAFWHAAGYVVDERLMRFVKDVEPRG